MLGDIFTHPFVQRLPQLVSNIVTFHAFDIEALRPSLQHTLVNVLLGCGI